MPSATDILFPISNIRRLWGGGGGENDPTSFTAGGGKYGGTGMLAPEGIDKSQDSLTQYMRSLTNMLGAEGQKAYGSGQKTLGTGENILTSSLPVLRQAQQGLARPEQYYKNLLSGDKAEMESAVAPETSSILDQYRGKRSAMAKLGPRGGGTNEAVAGSQFGQAADVSKVLQSVRPQAAAGARQVAGERAGIGKDIAGVGGALSGLGLQEGAQGIEQLQVALQGLLGRRGQNFQVDTANRQMLTQGLSEVYKSLV